ncbi:hypothetical protein ACKKBF_B00240 [Auxenochlorella protothecoides x Auxenochlorella symbiontica]
MADDGRAPEPVPGKMLGEPRRRKRSRTKKRAPPASNRAAKCVGQGAERNPDMTAIASPWAHSSPSYSLFGGSGFLSDDDLHSQHDSVLTVSGSASPTTSPKEAVAAPHPFTPAALRQCAKQVNMRLMHAHSPADIFCIVADGLEFFDSINLTAAFQRLAKFLAAHPRERPAVLSSPVFHSLAGMMVEQCHTGAFNPQSTSNAWWAVSKLFGGDAPAPPALLTALEAALGACLASGAESARPNAQAVSSTWYAWGRMGAYLPGTRVRDALWDRTYALALNFDSQGVANMVWSWGQLRRRHGDAFPVRTDVLAGLTLLVSRMPGAFAVQGLSCTAMGCANLGATLRAAALPLVRVLVREAGARAPAFNLQAMANTASALARMGGEAARDAAALDMLAAFDARAARLAGPHKPAELAALAGAMQRCGLEPRAPCLVGALERERPAVGPAERGGRWSPALGGRGSIAPPQRRDGAGGWQARDGHFCRATGLQRAACDALVAGERHAPGPSPPGAAGWPQPQAWGEGAAASKEVHAWTSTFNPTSAFSSRPWSPPCPSASEWAYGSADPSIGMWAPGPSSRGSSRQGSPTRVQDATNAVAWRGMGGALGDLDLDSWSSAVWSPAGAESGGPPALRSEAAEFTAAGLFLTNRPAQLRVR